MDVPSGDVLILTGLTKNGSLKELQKTLKWVEDLIERAIVEVAILIAGTLTKVTRTWRYIGPHDTPLDLQYYKFHASSLHALSKSSSERTALNFRSRLSPPSVHPNIHYIQHELVYIKLLSPRGPRTHFTVFGSPYTPKHSVPTQLDHLVTLPQWAFQYSKDESEKLWDSIPAGVDVIVTQVPPKGHLDRKFHIYDYEEKTASRTSKPLEIKDGCMRHLENGNTEWCRSSLWNLPPASGCEDLRMACWRCRPKLNIVGSITKGIFDHSKVEFASGHPRVDWRAERVTWRDGRYVKGMEERCACFPLTSEYNAHEGRWDVGGQQTEGIFNEKAIMGQFQTFNQKSRGDGDCECDRCRLEWDGHMYAGLVGHYDASGATRMFGGIGLRRGETITATAGSGILVVDIDLESWEGPKGD